MEHHDGKPVFRIDVPLAMPGPVATKDGCYTKRVLDTLGQPQCVPMSPQEIVSMGMITRGQDYAAAAAVGATHADLDPAEFDRYRRLCTLAGDSTASLQDEDILRALGLVPIGSPISLGALLLFGRAQAITRWVPNAEFIFQDLRRTESATNERIVGPLLRVTETLQTLIDARNSVTELMAGIHRVEVSLIPSVTRREAVANAIVHRDYAALGPTRVQINDADFVVSNPGGLPPGVTIQNILDESRPRSPILADAFKRAGLKMDKSRLRDYLLERTVPVVIGNAEGAEGKHPNCFYLLDHHHLTAAMWQALDDPKAEIFAEVRRNWAPLAGRRFWKALVSNNWVYPYDGMGAGPLNPDLLKTSVGSLENDLYRSLAWVIRLTYGFVKDPENPTFASSAGRASFAAGSCSTRS